MKRTIPLLAVLLTTTVLADQGPMQPQTFPPMMFPAMPATNNPYLMMPYGMPTQQMPYMPYGMPMQPAQQMPYMPYGMPMQQMPAMPFGMPFQTMPTQPAAQAPAPVAAPAPQPAPVAAPAPAPAPVAAPAPAPAPAPVATKANPYMPESTFNPFGMMMMMGMQSGSEPKRPYEMRRNISEAEKTQMVQMMLPMMTSMMKMGMPDMMNYMARKYKAQPGLSFDDVRDSLFLRANQLNMKKVGENLMWKDFQAVLNDQDAPRIEVYSFCDIDVGRELLKISPEFIVFLPCRIAVMEDADKAIWVLMLDWNLDWVAGYEQKLGINNALLQGSKSINDRMDEMMRAAANGDL